jgi:O-antigen/teichoic acid export membrane protein
MNLIRRNILWLLVSQLCTWTATFAALVIVPNKLGSTDFGTFAYAGAFTGFFLLIGGLGTSLYMSRAIARDYSLMGSYIWNGVLLKLAIWAVIAPAAFGLAYALGNRGQTLLLIAIDCAGMLPYLLSEVFFGGLTGMQRIARPAMWQVVQTYFSTVAGILVLELGGGVVPFTIIMNSGLLIPMTATAFMVRPFVREHRVVDFRLWRLLVVGGAPLLALAFLNLLYGTLDVPILHAISGSDPVGWYGVALKWVGIPLFITTAVGTAYYPAFSAQGKPMTKEFAPLVNRAVQIVLFVTIPASFGLSFVADDLIRLIYNQDFDSSIVLIRILAIGIPIIAIDTVLATALIAANRVKGYLAVAAIAACFNPILSAVAIQITDNRYGNGAIGAAAITVLTEFWILLGALHFRSPGVVDRVEIKRILRILAATAAMAPFLLLLSGAPIVVQVIVGVVVYAVASLAFGDITVAELRDVLRRSDPGQGPTAQPAQVADGDADADTRDENGADVPASSVDHELDPRP